LFGGWSFFGGSRFESQQQSSGWNRLSGLDVDFENLAGGGAGNLKRGFAGLELQNALLLRHGLAYLDEDLQDIAGVDTFAEVGEFYFNGHKIWDWGFGIWGS
jgi:hypothetical protein